MNSLLAHNITPEVYFRCVEDCFEPIMLTDLKGVLLYVNPSWCLTYGYTKAEAVGASPRLLRSEYQDDTFYRSMWKTILDPKVGFWRGEVVNKAKDGHLVPVLLTITPYRNPLGEILGYMGIAVDLSEQKQMQQQIVRQDRLASIGLLASGIAHEIGNPMGVIRGRAELLRNQVAGNEGAQKNVDLIIGQIDRITSLIQSLLKVSRVPEVIELQPVKLVDVVNEVEVLMREACKKAETQMEVKLNDETVMAEPGYLQQVLLNLVINSLHAINEKRNKSQDTKSGVERIEISTYQKDDVYNLVVKDSGCGIPAENIGRIFRPFFTTKPAGQGTGMGLAVTLKQVEEMKGKLSVASEGVGKGAVFTITLLKA